MKRSKAGIVIGIFLSIMFLSGSQKQAEGNFLFPLKAISPVTTPQGIQRFRLAVEYNQGERLLFQRADKNRNVMNLPMLDLSFGVASNVELLFLYAFLYLQQDGQSSNYGSGDLRIKGIYRVVREKTFFPACALNLGVKLPNADDTKEFGTNETDFFIGGAFLKDFGKLQLILNIDFGILGNPSSMNTGQDDLIMLKLAGIYPLSDTIRAALEFDGTEFSDFGNNRRFLRGGLSMQWYTLVIDAGGGIGLTKASGDFQVTIGATMKFGSISKVPKCPDRER